MRERKGLGGSNPPLSATQSVDLAYNLEKAEDRAKGRGFSILSAPENEERSGILQFWREQLLIHQGASLRIRAW